MNLFIVIKVMDFFSANIIIFWKKFYNISFFTAFFFNFAALLKRKKISK